LSFLHTFKQKQLVQNVIKLIINADDFGYSSLFNEKILELLECGAIRSTTAMVDWIKKDGQLAHLKQLVKQGKAGVGLHFVVGERVNVPQQIERQYNTFLDIFEFQPTHLDLHKWIDDFTLIAHLNRFAEEKRLAVRNMGLRAKTKQTTYPVFFSTYLKISQIKEYIDLMESPYSYEILTHPGVYDKEAASSLNAEREIDYHYMKELQSYLRKKKEIHLSHFGEL
jgi:predicted glycoside hydrolase/deacetylase ChbG (UPF0249 family)